MRGALTSLACLLAVAFAMSAAAVDQHSLLTTPLSRAPGNVLEAERVTYAPGETSRPHRHAGDAYVYVLSGHIRSQVDGQPLRVYAAGESWFEAAGALHKVSGNASDREPATMLVVFVAPAQAPPRTQSR